MQAAGEVPVDRRLQRMVVGVEGGGEKAYLPINVGVEGERFWCARAQTEIADAAISDRLRVSGCCPRRIQVVCTLFVPPDTSNVADGRDG